MDINKTTTTKVIDGETLERTTTFEKKSLITKAQLEAQLEKVNAERDTILEELERFK